MSDKSLPKDLQAMRDIENSLKDLEDNDERQRVITWVLDKFKLRGNLSNPNTSAGARHKIDSDGGDDQTVDMSVAEYYDAANPKTDAEKVLVVAAWRQSINGETYIDAQAVNTDLKHLGYGVGNITRAFEKLKGQKPALIIQTQKSGTSRQARKRFSVTRVGLQRVQDMINGS